MEFKEKVYCIAFVLTVAGATMFLNTPKNKTSHLVKNNIESLEFADYDLSNKKETIKLIRNSIEVGGDLEVDFTEDNNGITLLWNRVNVGDTIYKIYINDGLVKTLKSKGKELYHTVDNSNFKIGDNKISVEVSTSTQKTIKGELFFNFEAEHRAEAQEISFSEY